MTFILALNVQRERKLVDSRIVQSSDDDRISIENGEPDIALDRRW